MPIQLRRCNGSYTMVNPQTQFPFALGTSLDAFVSLPVGNDVLEEPMTDFVILNLVFQ